MRRTFTAALMALGLMVAPSSAFGLTIMPGPVSSLGGLPVATAADNHNGKDDSCIGMTLNSWSYKGNCSSGTGGLTMLSNGVIMAPRLKKLNDGLKQLKGASRVDDQLRLGVLSRMKQLKGLNLDPNQPAAALRAQQQKGQVKIYNWAKSVRNNRIRAATALCLAAGLITAAVDTAAELFKHYVLGQDFDASKIAEDAIKACVGAVGTAVAAKALQARGWVFNKEKL